MMASMTPFSTLTCLRKEKWCGWVGGGWGMRKTCTSASLGWLFTFLLREKNYVLFPLYGCWSLRLMKQALHHKFPFGHSVLRTCIQQPYHFGGKSQSLMGSASFSHTEISFDSSPKHMLKSNMRMQYTDPSKQQSVLWRKFVDSPAGVGREKCISFRSGNCISEPSSGPREGRASSFPSYGERESKCHFPLQLWIITFMLWDRVCFFNMKNDILFGWDISLNA